MALGSTQRGPMRKHILIQGATVALILSLSQAGCLERDNGEAASPDGGFILRPVNGCSVIGASQIAPDTPSEGRVRTELLGLMRATGLRYEVRCSDLSARLYQQVTYDGSGSISRTRNLNNGFSASGPLAPAFAQVCAISKGEVPDTEARFGSAAEFEGKKKAVSPSYFAGQPPCVRYSGPPTIVDAAD